LCAVGVALGRFQSQSRNAGHSDPISLTYRTLWDPAPITLEELSNGVSDFISGFTRSGFLVRENKRLRAMEGAMALYKEEIGRRDAEIERLRSLLELPQIPGKSRGYFPNEGRATLNIGTNRGVKKNMPVIAAEGLVGIVQTADGGTSQILLISSPQMRIVGMVQRDPPPVGFIRGQSAGAMVFEVTDAKAVVQNGDMVYTSGFSERIPPGIKIGRIVQIEEDVAFGSKRCQVFPEVQVGAAREVFVLK
jgi:rod shape-determining protein MreC